MGFQLPSNRVHFLMQITTQDTAGHPWPTSPLSSPDLSNLRGDASPLAPPLMAHQPTAGSPFPFSPWDPPPLRRPCSRRLTFASSLSLIYHLGKHIGALDLAEEEAGERPSFGGRGSLERNALAIPSLLRCPRRAAAAGKTAGTAASRYSTPGTPAQDDTRLQGRQRNCQPKSRNRIRERR
jgi:hypothetical protein